MDCMLQWAVHEHGSMGWAWRHEADRRYWVANWSGENPEWLPDAVIDDFGSLRGVSGP